jgi:hypothetical protein
MNPMFSVLPTPSTRRSPVCSKPSASAVAFYFLLLISVPPTTFGACPEAFVEVRLLSAERFRFGFEPYTNQTSPKKFYLTERLTYQYGATNSPSSTNYSDTSSLTNSQTNRYDLNSFVIVTQRADSCSVIAVSPTCTSVGAGHRVHTNFTVPATNWVWNAVRTNECQWFMEVICIGEYQVTTNICTNGPVECEFIQDWECTETNWSNVVLTETTRGYTANINCSSGSKVESVEKGLNPPPYNP